MKRFVKQKTTKRKNNALLQNILIIVKDTIQILNN